MTRDMRSRLATLPTQTAVDDGIRSCFAVFTKSLISSPPVQLTSLQQRHVFCLETLQATRRGLRIMDSGSGSSSSDHNQRNQSEKNQSCPSAQGKEAPVTQDLKTEHRTDSLESVPELPQRKMGNKKSGTSEF
ncbi:hypothetical protein KOW79_010086 [Hemibagrus wyckioides]|uniref:Uncharacterized protein n=1 Tax=Hemibagrus wyckioides TaxID=337641 RepID=A0A9D3NT79_9TELE|nr:hypothetical protein KOW79_010086 [Hemibagrus wyckioides]